MQNKWSNLLTVLVVIALISEGYLGYEYYILNQQNLNLNQDKTSLETEKQSLLDNLEASQREIDLKNTQISTLTVERNNLENKYMSEAEKVAQTKLILGSTKDTIGVLERLNATDPEILKKYSKVYFLSDNYSPKKLVKIDSIYSYNPNKEMFFLEGVFSHLKQMMDDAYADGIDIKIISAYRSFGEQASLKYSYTVTYGTGANKFSADQGYSEHQIGTAIDFSTEELNGSLTASSFEKSETHKWLNENAHKYGFILSYPRGNDYYQFEPWHWRFIGVDFATRLREEGRSFYELEQRLIDTYLISFFD